MNSKRLIAGVTAALLAMTCISAFSEAVSADDDAEKIRAVQSELAVLQLLTQEQISGVWDESTIEATMRFQRFVNNIQGEGTLEESGECDAETAGFLEFAAGKGWNIADQVSADDVMTPAELEAQAQAEQEALQQKLENDKATISYMQSMLRQLGLLEEINGEYDEKTQNAIICAQKYINEKMGIEVVPVNGAYDDSETMIYLNKAAEQNWVIPLVEETPEPVAEETEGEGPQVEATHAPKEGVSAITDFVLGIDGEEKSGTVQITAGKHTVAWKATGVSMFSMYLYDQNGNLLTKEEAIPTNYFTLDTFGMASGAVYEVRIGAVPIGGQVEDMEWRSLFLTLA